MARVRTTIAPRMASSLTCGYIIWFPDYHNGAQTFASGAFNSGYANVFGWSSTESFNQPSPNVSLFPLGSQNNWTLAPTPPTAGRTLQGLVDPACQFLSGTIVQDARTLSACLSLTYTGQMSHASGELAYIEDFPLRALLSSPSGTPQRAPSVDEMFNYSTNITRFGTDRYEVLHRPNEGSEHFKDGGFGPPTAPNPAQAPTSVLVIGDASQANSLSSFNDIALAQQPTAIGFAWRGLDPDMGDATQLSINLVKNIEWRAKTISGLTHATAVSYSPSSQMPKALTVLDRKVGGWTTRIGNSTQSMVGAVSQAALTGASGLLSRAARGAGNMALGHIARMTLGGGGYAQIVD